MNQIRFFDNQVIRNHFMSVAQSTACAATTAEPGYNGDDRGKWAAAAHDSLGNLSGFMYGAVSFWKARQRDTAGMLVVAGQAEALRSRAEVLLRGHDASADWRALQDEAAPLWQAWDEALGQCINPTPFANKNNRA